MGKPRPVPKSGPKLGPKDPGPKAAHKPAAAKPAIKAKQAGARSAPIASGKPKKAGANGDVRSHVTVGLAPVPSRPSQPEVVIPETPPPLPSPIASFTF